MKISEFIQKNPNPFFSFEIIPPKRGGSIDGIFKLIEQLVPFEPPFIDVTSHAAEVYYQELADGVVKKHVKRKRPGTLGLCAGIKSKYGIEAVPHLLCEGFTAEETEDALIELNYLGIQNVLALRGDNHGFAKPLASNRTKNLYASDLVAQINRMNNGHYIEELMDAAPTDFCIGVAGYPEKHFEAPNLEKDIEMLKRKQDAGAHYVVTQLFYDNKVFFDYVERCRAAGITIPILPGLKLISTKNHLSSLPKSFFINLPADLVNEIEAARPDQVADIGVEWAKKQAEELMSAGFPVHFYIMQSAKNVKKVLTYLKQKS